MQQLNLGLITQRQTNHRSTYIPIRPYFDRSHYTVEPVENETVARPFILKHHYAASFPVAIASFGLFDIRPAARGDRLVGICTFAVPMNTAGHITRLLLPSEKPCELSRLVLTDDVLANAETFFVIQSIRQLRELKQTPEKTPRHPLITSFSDPQPRTDRHGNLQFRGHYGCIYQAANSLYLGRGTARTLWLAPNGQSVVARTISKIVNDESGAAGAYQQLVNLGAALRGPFETPQQWIARLKETAFLRPLRHAGNHAYLFRAAASRKRNNDFLKISQPTRTGRRPPIPSCHETRTS